MKLSGVYEKDVCILCHNCNDSFSVSREYFSYVSDEYCATKVLISCPNCGNMVAQYSRIDKTTFATTISFNGALNRIQNFNSEQPISKESPTKIVHESIMSNDAALNRIQNFNSQQPISKEPSTKTLRESIMSIDAALNRIQNFNSQQPVLKESPAKIVRERVKGFIFEKLSELCSEIERNKREDETISNISYSTINVGSATNSVNFFGIPVTKESFVFSAIVVYKSEK